MVDFGFLGKISEKVGGRGDGVVVGIIDDSVDVGGKVVVG